MIVLPALYSPTTRSRGTAHATATSPSSVSRMLVVRSLRSTLSVASTDAYDVEASSSGGVVGDVVGEALGAALGEAVVGDTLGDTVGEGVGEVVGDAVGARVAPPPHAQHASAALTPCEVMEGGVERSRRCEQKEV